MSSLKEKFSVVFWKTGVSWLKWQRAADCSTRAQLQLQMSGHRWCVVWFAVPWAFDGRQIVVAGVLPTHQTFRKWLTIFLRDDGGDVFRQYVGWRTKTTSTRSQTTSRTSISMSSTASSGSWTATTTCSSAKKISVDTTTTVLHTSYTLLIL